MLNFLIIGTGGFIGAIARFAVASWVGQEVFRRGERISRSGTLDRVFKDKVVILEGGRALNMSEARFVRDLRDFWEQEKDRLMAGKDVYVLRNLSRGKGVGFFEGSAFYPDFILWVVDQQQKTQCIIFVEPHGMLHAKAYMHDEKARLHERLPRLAQEVAQRSQREGISLDSFIVSATPYDELYQRYDEGMWERAKFAKHHILFPERNQDYDCL